MPNTDNVLRLSRRLLRGTYERVSQKLLKGIPKPKPFTKVIGGRLMTATASLHRTLQGRRWNTFWRIKNRRKNVSPHSSNNL